MGTDATLNPSRRFGKVVEAAIHLATLLVAHHLLEWGWPSFVSPAWGVLAVYPFDVTDLTPDVSWLVRSVLVGPLHLDRAAPRYVTGSDPSSQPG